MPWGLILLRWDPNTHIIRLQNAVLRPLDAMFRSPQLMAFALRQLGATVGRNTECAHEIVFSGPLDLLRIGNNVAIQTGAYIQTARWMGSTLQIGRVHLEQGCKIGMRACVGNDTNVLQLTDYGVDDVVFAVRAGPDSLDLVVFHVDYQHVFTAVQLLAERC